MALKLVEGVAQEFRVFVVFCVFAFSVFVFRDGVSASIR
jgi:hypothetical protein